MSYGLYLQTFEYSLSDIYYRRYVKQTAAYLEMKCMSYQYWLLLEIFSYLLILYHIIIQLCILFKILLKFVSMGACDNKSALVQVIQC